MYGVDASCYQAVAVYGVVHLDRRTGNWHAPVPDSLRMTMEFVVAPPAKYLRRVWHVSHRSEASLDGLFLQSHEQSPKSETCEHVHP